MVHRKTPKTHQRASVGGLTLTGPTTDALGVIHTRDGVQLNTTNTQTRAFDQFTTISFLFLPPKQCILGTDCPEMTDRILLIPVGLHPHSRRAERGVASKMDKHSKFRAFS